MSDFDPGDVRLATVNGERMLVLRGRGIFEGNWYTQGPVAGSRLSVTDSWLLDPRPLVVIDPESRDGAGRLLDLLWSSGGWGTDGTRSELIDNFQTALREFANPTPPKPDEPKGLGAVVEASCVCYAETKSFVRNANQDPDDPWLAGCGWHAWSDLDAVKVLSEGVADV